MPDVLALADQRKAVGDGQQLAAAFDAAGVEALGEQAAHRRNEGGAAGQEYLVDIPGLRAGLVENLVQRALDAGKIGSILAA